MALKDSEKALLLGVAGIAAAGLSFVYAAKPNMEKVKSINAENVALRQRLSELQTKQADRDRYLAETEEYLAEYDTVLNSFPADLNQEVTIMFVQGIRDNYEFNAESMEMGEKEQFYTLGIGGGDTALGAQPVATTDDTTSEETTEAPAMTSEDVAATPTIQAANYDCYRAIFPIKYSGDYQSIKDVVAYIDNFGDRMTVNSINIAYEPEDDVYTGTIEMYCYSVEGEDRPERTVDLNGVETGVNNIFNSGAAAGSTAQNSLTKYDDTEGAAIESSYDFYTMLNPASSDVSAKVVGQNGAGKDASVISGSDDSVSAITYDFYEKDGKTYCKYTLDNANSYEAEVTSAEDVKVLIKSTARKDNDDKVGARITINNSSSIPVYVKVSGDDSVSPRVTIVGKSGSVKVYK